MKLFLFLLSFFTFFNVSATHIIGGEIYYDYLGNNQYRISVAVFRDCQGNGAPFDPVMSLAIYSSSNVLIQNVSVPLPPTTQLPIIFTNPCVVAPTGYCTEKAVYTTVVTLPPTTGGYTITYQRCCRRPDVLNINNPGDTGLTLTAHITGTNSNAIVNSSPRFPNYPPLILCNNDDLVFNHSATDPDGDVLVYELTTPYAGASDLSPQPNPPPPPPYTPVQWAPGITATTPLGSGASISINPNTGQLTADPELSGLFVVGIKVKEYRNGVLIGETIRDFIFKVINCNITLQSIIVEQEDMPNFTSFCQGLTIAFKNNTFGASTYNWDFGVPNITTDVSTQHEPTYTFPAPGTYTVTLIANKGWPCTDTSVQVFEVHEYMDVNYTISEDSICLKDNSFDFDGAAVGPAGMTYSWNFGPTASIPGSTNLDVNNVSFTSSGFIPVTLTANYQSLCTKTFKDSVYIYPGSIADFELPTVAECDGLTVQFDNNSTNAANNFWNFGVPNTTTDVSTQLNPTYSFPAGGTYNVTLIVNNNNQCSDTLQLPITVYDELMASFIHNDSMCISQNSFNFDGTVAGPSSMSILWNFGPHASPQTSNQEDVSNVVFDTSGVFPVTLTVSFNSCVETVSSTVTIFKVPKIDFTIDPGLKCAPYDAQFIDLSESDTPISYIWDFGDGTTSTEQHPFHLYENPGLYNITLSIITTEGCVDTLHMYKPDIVQVRPTPTSDFSVNPLITDICNPKVDFADESSGATNIVYYFDEHELISEELNPVFYYMTPGQKRPMQIATNEFGCKDTSYQQLFIEPFTVYIPNTFTPDGNEFNGVFDAVTYLPVSSWKFRIYNRWGQLLFVSDDPNIGWDGTFNGALVQEGIYAYVLEYIGCDSNVVEHTLTGHVNLIK